MSQFVNQFEPKVSIAIPTFNRAEYITRAVNSALIQSYKNIEVIVVDNASTDCTQSLVGEIADDRLRYHRHETNIGIGNNWQACLNLASGKYLLILSDDDYLHPNAIENLIAPFLDNISGPEDDRVALCISICRANIINENGQVTKGPSQESIVSVFDFVVKMLVGKSAYYPSATLMEVESSRQIGFDLKRFTYAFDAGMIIALCMRSTHVVFVKECMVSYEEHPDNISKKIEFDVLEKDILNLGAAYLDFSRTLENQDQRDKIVGLTDEFCLRRLCSMVLKSRSISGSLPTIRRLLGIRKRVFGFRTFKVYLGFIVRACMPLFLITFLKRFR